jgi:F0F1-type ATP synthase assembly protein I
MTDGPTPEQQDMRAIGVATGLGCSIVAALVLCIGGGVWLDGQFGTSPVLTLAGVALGLVVAAYQLWELAKVGSKTARPGPMARTMARLPMPGSARTLREQDAPARANERQKE